MLLINEDKRFLAWFEEKNNNSTNLGAISWHLQQMWKDAGLKSQASGFRPNVLHWGTLSNRLTSLSLRDSTYKLKGYFKCHLYIL